jgi:hypothetical protein
MLAKLFMITAALFSVVTVNASPVVFDDPVIFNSDITTYQKSEINDPRFVFVDVDYSVNDDGGAMALPEQPVGYAIFPLNGVPQYFPYYNAPLSASAKASAKAEVQKESNCNNKVK